MKNSCPQAKIVLSLMILWLCAALPAFGGDDKIFAGWDGTRFRSPEQTYRVGLALSGGGARGISQIGVLKAFEDAGISVESIAGTSIGGIVGGLYAAGYSADTLEKIIEGIRFAELFTNRPGRTSMFLTQRPEKDRYLISIRFDGLKPYIPRALTAGQKLTDLMTGLTVRANYISGGDFSHLPIPFAAATTDIVTGREYVFEKGNLATAMRATMAFPLAFTGVSLDSMLLMDGGIVNPIPVNIIPDKNGNFDLKVAVNTTSDLLPKDKIGDAIDIANQVTGIMQTDKIKSGMKAADIVIVPEIDDYYSSDFESADSLIAAGYRSGIKASREIKSMIDQRYGRDTIYITTIKYPEDDAIRKLDWSPLIPGGIVRNSDLGRIAGELIKRNDLLNLSIVRRPTGNVIAGFECYDMEISAIPAPKIDKIEVHFAGNMIFPDEELFELLSKYGPTLSPEDMVAFLDEIENVYGELGYHMAHAKRVAYNHEAKILNITVDEGRICEIAISGNVRTKDWLIASNFPLKNGQPFNSEKAAQGIANIFSTDLFERVIMDVLPTDSGAVVALTVEEKKYLQLRLGWHWHDEYNSEQFVEFLDDNLFGTGQEFLLHAQYGTRRQVYEGTLKADRFFSTYLTYRARGYYRIMERHLYDAGGGQIETVNEKRLGGEFILGQQIKRFGTVTGEIRFEEIDNDYDTAGVSDNIKLRTFGLRSHVETINRMPYPNSGKRHIFLIEFAAEILGGKTRFTRGYSAIESYFPINERLNFHPKLSIGWTDSNSPIPLPEKFYLGGMDSFYGYRTEELIGDKMILGNLELRYRLPYRFYFYTRYDVGEVYPSADQIKLKNLRHGIGFALSFDSPLGPISVGYGLAEKDHDRIYFSAGLDF